VLLTLFRKGNGAVVVSLRSLNGEALKVAETLRGGGHPNASGAVLPRSVQSVSDAVIYLRKVLNPSAEPAGKGGWSDLECALDGQG
jgi:nanoRNase/pAp phosphatase (c-di-AMP/oligoRNAs hydrolase)